MPFLLRLNLLPHYFPVYKLQWRTSYSCRKVVWSTPWGHAISSALTARKDSPSWIQQGVVCLYGQRCSVTWQQRACSDGCGNASIALKCKEELLVRPAQKAVHLERVWHQGWGAEVQLKGALPANSFGKTFLELKNTHKKSCFLYPHTFPFSWLQRSVQCVMQMLSCQPKASTSLEPWEAALWQLCRTVLPIQILFHLLKFFLSHSLFCLHSFSYVCFSFILFLYLLDNLIEHFESFCTDTGRPGQVMRIKPSGKDSRPRVWCGLEHVCLPKALLS